MGRNAFGIKKDDAGIVSTLRLSALRAVVFGEWVEKVIFGKKEKMPRKQLHFTYYVMSFARLMTPKFILRWRAKKYMKEMEGREDRELIMRRVEYYNQLEGVTRLAEGGTRIGDHTWGKHVGPSVYFFDTVEHLRYFGDELVFHHKPGDVWWLFDTPTIAKTRPIAVGDARYKNSVLMNLDKLRHFFFVKDKVAFADKKPTVLFRGACHGKPERIQFLEMYKGKEGFDIGDTSRKLEERLQSERMSIREHLGYRYIVTLEGNDVATSLKWVMSTNSIAVMPRPTRESWFMEGTLVANYHYIEIKPDFSDIEERLRYYNEHLEEAEAIVEHAHEYIRQFEDARREEIISYLVVRRYFERTTVREDGEAQIS